MSYLFVIKILNLKNYFKMKSKRVFVEFPVEITEKWLIETILKVVEIKDASKFIAKLDTCFEDWSVTTALIRHFKHVENVWKVECDNFEEPYGDLSAKEIKF